MAIMNSRDWKKLIQFCKNETQNTKGDKRAARGLLYRLTFYISENRLVHPQSRERQEPPIQQSVFDKFDGGVREEGSPLSPKEVLSGRILLEREVLPENKETRETQHPDPNGRDQFLSPKEVSNGSRASESEISPKNKEGGEVSQRPDPGGRDQVPVEEGGEEIPGIIDAGKGWPDLEPQGSSQV